MEPKIVAYPVPLKTISPAAAARPVVLWMPDVRILGSMAAEAQDRYRAKFSNTMRFAKSVAASEVLLRSLAHDDWRFYPPRTLRLRKDDYASTRALDEGDDQFSRALEEMLRLGSLTRETVAGDRGIL
jgi:hypothetical protein